MHLKDKEILTKFEIMARDQNKTYLIQVPLGPFEVQESIEVLGVYEMSPVDRSFLGGSPAEASAALRPLFPLLQNRCCARRSYVYFCTWTGASKCVCVCCVQYLFCIVFFCFSFFSLLFVYFFVCAQLLLNYLAA